MVPVRAPQIDVGCNTYRREMVSPGRHEFTTPNTLNCQWVNILDCTSYTPQKVCGTDNKTYDNSCYLAKAQCQQDNSFHLKALGPCAGTTAMSTTSAGSGSVTTTQAVPVTDTNTLNCQWVHTLECTAYTTQKVCGTDNKTYANSCYLANAQCKDGSIHLKAWGTCAGTTAMPTTSTGSGSVTTTQAEPSTTKESVFTNHNQLSDFFCLELMHIACPSDIEMVCGTDNVTYDNVCKYEKAKCVYRPLTIKHVGMC